MSKRAARLLVCIAGLALGLAPRAFVSHAPIHTRKKHICARALNTFPVGNITTVLKAAHRAWGASFEDAVRDSLESAEYVPLIGDTLSVAMGKNGELDALCVGNAEAWRSFASDKTIDMNDDTKKLLEQPHVLVAEVSLTVESFRRKMQSGSKSLLLMDAMMSNCDVQGLPCVKVIVFDGITMTAPPEIFNDFLASGGVLVNIPYLSADSVLQEFKKVDEQSKKIDELQNKMEEQSKQFEEQMEEQSKLFEEQMEEQSKLLRNQSKQIDELLRLLRPSLGGS